MSSPRNALLIALDRCRTILGPTVMDLRPTSVQVITRTWSEGQRGPPGFPTDAILNLPNYTKVRHVTQREIANSGGTYEMGDIVVGPITPQYTDTDGTIKGFVEAQLAPIVTDPSGSTEVLYSVALESGATGINGIYTRRDFKRDKSLRFMLILQRQLNPPGP